VVSPFAGDIPLLVLECGLRFALVQSLARSWMIVGDVCAIQRVTRAVHVLLRVPTSSCLLQRLVDASVMDRNGAFKSAGSQRPCFTAMPAEVDFCCLSLIFSAACASAGRRTSFPHA
jgi:hypothetical protein